MLTVLNAAVASALCILSRRINKVHLTRDNDTQNLFIWISANQSGENSQCTNGNRWEVYIKETCARIGQPLNIAQLKLSIVLMTEN